MKTIALVTVAAVALAVPAMASDMKGAAPAHEMAAHDAKPMEMKDGSWAKMDGNKVMVSKDGGKTWMAAPDGTWEMKDGSKIMTKGGMKM